MKKNYDFSKARRGAVVASPHGKTRITIRIDNDILDWFRRKVHEAGGGSYQTLVNRALREHVHRSVEPFEDTLRRVLRQELGVGDGIPVNRVRESDDATLSTPNRRRHRRHKD
jgi:hypothetical protein